MYFCISLFLYYCITSSRNYIAGTAAAIYSSILIHEETFIYVCLPQRLPKNTFRSNCRQTFWNAFRNTFRAASQGTPWRRTCALRWLALRRVEAHERHAIHDRNELNELKRLYNISPHHIVLVLVLVCWIGSPCSGPQVVDLTWQAAYVCLAYDAGEWLKAPKYYSYTEY